MATLLDEEKKEVTKEKTIWCIPIIIKPRRKRRFSSLQVINRSWIKIL